MQAQMAGTTNDPNCTDRDRAKQAFDALDADKSGYLDANEVKNLLQQWKVAESLLKKFNKEGQLVSFEEFYRYIWRVGNVKIQNETKEKHKTNEKKARFIFDCLDIDGSGTIDKYELQKLLIQWGLPEGEVDEYLAADEDK
jgi:Ca2+-binding EF-hand superfamily protein